MGQKILAAILLIAVLGQTFNQGWYYLDYVVQQKEYIKQCVNKARPKLQCKGKCQLMKKLKEQEQQERQAPEMKLASKSEVISSKSSFLSALPLLTRTLANEYHLFSAGTPVDQPSSVFHPPNA